MFNFLMNGLNYSLESLSPKLDLAFMHLYEAFAGPKPFDLRQFQEAVFEFLDQNQNSRRHDNYFENFTILWTQYRDSGRYEQAEAVWDLALKSALLWEEQHPGAFVHKGTPFYFWGMTAILRGEIDRGYSLMHRALKEDERTDPLNFRQKPGFYFATLNYKEAGQAFRSWLMEQAKVLNEQLRSYNAFQKRNLTLDDFQSKFLSKPPSLEAISLLGYVIARLMRFEGIPGFALKSDFAGQLEGNLLFDLVSIVDAAIHKKNPRKRQFIDHAEHLSRARGGNLTSARLGEMNGRFQDHFEETMTLLLDNGYKIEDGSPLDAADAAIGVTYGIRNKWAHGVPTATVIWKRFQEIRQRAFDTLFLTADFLY